MAAFELAGDSAGQLIAAAHGEDEVRLDVWDVEAAALIGSFSSSLSLFGGRLAVATAEDGPVIVAAAWGVPGVRAHDPATGDVRWERRDLVRSGPVTSGGASMTVGVGFGDRSSEVLDATTGETITRVRGGRKIHVSPYGAVAVVGHDTEVALHDVETWERIWRAPIEGFALASTAFAPDAVLTVDAVDGDGGARTPAICRGLDAAERWRYEAEARHSIPWLAWDERGEAWVLVEYDFDGGGQTLVRLSADGTVVARWPHSASMSTYAFVDRGRRLVTADGVVVDTLDGSRAASLAFAPAA